MRSYFSKNILNKSLFKKQNEKISDFLPYEECITKNGRDLFILTDGSIGVMWEITPIAHECLSNEEIETALERVSQIFDICKSDKVSMQFIYSSSRSSRCDLPDYYNNPKHLAHSIMSSRVDHVCGSKDDKKLVSKKVYLALRVSNSLAMSLIKSKNPRVYEYVQKSFSKTMSELENKASLIESHFKTRVGVGLERLCGGEVVSYIRKRLHSSSFRENNSKLINGFSGAGSNRLSDALMYECVEWQPSEIKLGDSEREEVLSWSNQPNKEYSGMLTEILKHEGEIQCVVNVRSPDVNDSDLDYLSERLKNAGTSKKERQKKELKNTEDRISYGESLLNVSFHIFIRSSLKDTKDKPGEDFAKRFTASCIPMSVEKTIALPVFLNCLPFCYSGKTSGFIRRERRVLSRTAASYLPLFAGNQSGKDFGQLMQSRAGGSIWINKRSSETNPHCAVLGSSGSGKSFYISNYLVSEVANEKDPMIFIIDSITSQENLVSCFNEDFNTELIKPPEKYPNLFEGEISSDNLPFIIETISASVALVSETKLTSSEKVLLSDSILKAYSENKLNSGLDYVYGDESSDGYYKEVDSAVSNPRMSQIVDLTYGVCEDLSISTDVADTLREKLLPFFGSGPYSVLFDQKSEYSLNGRAPTISLFDLENLQGDKTLITMTTLVLIVQMNRLIANKENRGRKGVLLIDEAGVNLGGSSPELEEFVKSAFTRFRKLGIVCITVTNNVDHYVKIPALKAAWELSANKVILPLSSEEIIPFKKSKLFENDYYSEIIGSLRKKNGSHSEYFYCGNSYTGTLRYSPTGYDYWLAVSDPVEVSNFEAVRSHFNCKKKALEKLADKYPLGVRKNGKIEKINEKCLLEMES